MVATEAEAGILSGIDAGKTPPCQMGIRLVTGEELLCGQPSSVRVHIHCTSCGHEVKKFLCLACFEDLSNYTTACGHCLRAGRPSDYTFREI